MRGVGDEILKRTFQISLFLIRYHLLTNHKQLLRHPSVEITLHHVLVNRTGVLTVNLGNRIKEHALSGAFSFAVDD